MNFKKYLAILVGLLLMVPASAMAQNVTVSEDVTIYLEAIGKYFNLKSTSSALDQIVVNSTGSNFTITTNLSTGTVTITSTIGVDMGGSLNSSNLAITCDTSTSTSTLVITANTTAALNVIVTPTGSICSPTVSSPSGGPGGGPGPGPGPSPTPTPAPTPTPGEEPAPAEGEEEPAEGELVFSGLLDFATLRSHWCFSFCQEAHDAGVMTGRVDSDGKRTFAPNDLMNRAELSKVAVTTVAQTSVLGASPFPDVDDSNIWYFGWVLRAKLLEFVTGYADGNFYPANFITRGEVAVVFARMTEEDLPDCDNSPFPADVPTDHFACQYIALMKDLEFMRGDTDVDGNLLGTFRPNDYMTRGEIAVMVSKFIDWQ